MSTILFFVCSVDQIKKCARAKMNNYCIGNEDDFKCQIAERCADSAQESEEAKKECISRFCQEPENENKLECMALFCKASYKEMERYYCLKIACTSNQNHRICQRIRSCEEENSGMNSVGFVGMLAKLSFAKCLMENTIGEDI